MLDPNTVIRIRAENGDDVRIKTDETTRLHLKLSGDGYSSSTNVYSDTTEHWNLQKNLIGKKNCFYVYTDYLTDQNGKLIPGVKFGDGKAYLIDAPFLNASVEIIENHINDKLIHVSKEDREFWDNKVTAFMGADISDERLILTKEREEDFNG